jgi:hypothetical protein
VAGVAAGLFMVVAELARGASAVPAFFVSLAAAAAVTGLTGIWRQIWHGAEVTEAPIPLAGGLTVEATEPLRGTIEDLSLRMDEQMAVINRRLHQLETRVFDAPPEADLERR